MQALNDWVRGLVALVMVATILELLVPMTRMKKYVRMSMGLLAVLAVTRPILGLLGQPITVDTGLFTTDTKGRVPTVDQVLADGRALSQKNQEMVTAQARSRLEAEAAAAAADVAGVAEARAAVTLRSGKAGEINTVAVTIVKGDRHGVPSVRPVAPVKVGKDQQSAVTPPASREPQPDENHLADAVVKAVATRLGMEVSSHIRVLISDQQAGR